MRPWVRPGRTTFFFVNDGPERALELALESAGSRDVRIAGGADVIQQYLNLGAVSSWRSPSPRCSSAARPGLDPMPFSGAPERPGIYTITIRKPGYRDWVRSGVRVTRDECHVRPVRLTALLQRAP